MLSLAGNHTVPRADFTQVMLYAYNKALPGIFYIKGQIIKLVFFLYLQIQILPLYRFKYKNTNFSLIFSI